MNLISHLTGYSEASESKAVDRPPHHTEQGFNNPYLDAYKKNLFSYLKMRWFGNDKYANHAKNAHKVPITDTLEDLRPNPENLPRVTWLGHSTFLIQYGKINLLTDPILSKRASPVSFAGPKRLVPIPIGIDALPPIDFVIISHNHYDHLDQWTIEKLGNGPRYLVPLRLGRWFEDIGINRDRVLEFDWWDSRTVNGITATATPSQHWSGRGLTDRLKTLWAAWHIEIEGFSFWFAGDTGYNPYQFKAVGNRWNGVDLALIPIGAYAPRWFMKKHHINPEEAIKIHEDVQANKSIGMHWGTFQLSAEPIDEPKNLIEQAVTRKRIESGEFITMAIGESITITNTSIKP